MSTNNEKFYKRFRKLRKLLMRLGATTEDLTTLEKLEWKTVYLVDVMGDDPYGTPYDNSDDPDYGPTCCSALPTPPPEPTSIVLPGGATITERSCADHLPITGRNFFKEEVNKLLGRSHE